MYDYCTFFVLLLYKNQKKVKICARKAKKLRTKSVVFTRDVYVF